MKNIFGRCSNSHMKGDRCFSRHEQLQGGTPATSKIDDVPETLQWQGGIRKPVSNGGTLWLFVT